MSRVDNSSSFGSVVGNGKVKVNGKVNARRTMLALLWFTFLFTFSIAAHAFDHAPWDGLLKRHVSSTPDGQSTQVDYAGFKLDRAMLKQYLVSTSSVGRTDFDAWSASEQLAFLINAYNAWTVELVLTGYPGIDSIKDLGSFFQSPWKKDFITLLGERRSLDDIEHGLIRGSGRYSDPRIHFAVNCASIGCPALRAEAYVALRLNAQLDDATQRFLQDKSRNRVSDGRIKVSSIFKWYRQDFEKGWRGASSLGAFLALYRAPLGINPTLAADLAAGKVGIDFLDYDWRLNTISVNAASAARAARAASAEQ